MVKPYGVRVALADTFRQLHHRDEILLMPNPWDVGSAKIMQSLGFPALATTSSGAAAARGRLDGAMGRELALREAAEIVAAVDVPVSADLENGFADDAGGVAETIELAVEIGLAGASVEDWDGAALYERRHATDRVRAAVAAAAGRLVITARAENHIRGVDDLDDTITRLQSYVEAGADVVFAPGIRSAEQIGTVVRNVEAPVSVLAVPGVPAVAELGRLGVRRVSTGGALAFASYAAMADAAGELLDHGTFGYLSASRRGGEIAGNAFA